MDFHILDPVHNSMKIWFIYRLLLRQHNNLTRRTSIINMKTEQEIIEELQAELEQCRTKINTLEKQKDEFQNYFEIFIQNAGDILFIYNLKTWKTEFISPSIKNITGFSVEEALDHTLDQVMTKESFDFIKPLKMQRAEQLLKNEISNKLYTDELVNLKKDGTTYCTECNDLYTTKKDGTPIIVGILRDIDQRKKLEHSLKNTNARLSKIISQKDKLFSIIGHDLKNSTGNIMGLLEILDADYDNMSSAAIKEIISLSLKTSIGLNNILLDLLEWGLTSSGDIEVSKTEIRLEEMLQEVYNQMEYHAVKKDITITIQNNLSTVFSDKNLLKPILRNLI